MTKADIYMFETIQKIENYGFNITLNEIYARFHGKIVEYMKKKDS